MYEYVSFIYKPSITAMQELSAIKVAIQSRSHINDKLSHNQVFPQPKITSNKDDGGAFVDGPGACKTKLLAARATSFTKQISP
jgi:hypothetical protein